MNFLRKYIRKLLSEAILDIHYSERLYDRLINMSTQNVGYEIPGTVGEYKIIGTYIIPDNIKSQIIENAKIIEKYNFPKAKSFGILIANIIIDKNKVNYNAPELKAEAANKVLVLVDEKTNSNGNVVYAIVRENILKTIYFAKSYVPQDAAKLRVDVIVKNIDTIKTGKIR